MLAAHRTHDGYASAKRHSGRRFAPVQWIHMFGECSAPQHRSTASPHRLHVGHPRPVIKQTLREAAEWGRLPQSPSQQCWVNFGRHALAS